MMNRPSNWLPFFHLVALFILLPVRAFALESALPSPIDRKVDYLSEIKPILESRCYECHGPAKQKSGFRIDARDSALQGGDYGIDILPGNSAESPLIQYVAGAKKDMVMPPSGERLTEQQVSVLRAWIDQGVEWPEGEAVASVTHEV